VSEIIKSEFIELLISSVDLGQGEPLDRKVTQESLRFSKWSKRPKDISFLTIRLVRESKSEQQEKFAGRRIYCQGEGHAFQGSIGGTIPKIYSAFIARGRPYSTAVADRDQQQDISSIFEEGGAFIVAVQPYGWAQTSRKGRSI